MSESEAIPTWQALDAELKNALLRRILADWECINYNHFNDVLRAPIFQVSPARGRLGEWCRSSRTLRLSETCLFERPWVVTIETLRHEMAHQFVDEVLGGESRPHGPHFRATCERLGIDPGAAEDPTRTRDAAPGPEDRVIDRVRKLLALAESSNRHEAELAAATAQRLMLKFNVEVDRAHSPDRRGHGVLWLGTPTGRVHAHLRELAQILRDHFFVNVLWVSAYRPLEGKSGSVMEVFGRPENLQMAEFVHDFLLRTTQRLWAEHRRREGLPGNRGRLNFLAGAMAGFRAKLREQSRGDQAQGLVWTGRGEVEAYMRRRHPRIVTVRTSGRHGRDGYADGVSAGRDIVLSGPVGAGTSEYGGRPRALPPGRDR